MNIFNYLNNLLFTKKGKVQLDIDHTNDYQPYLINRWLSMYSKDIACIINNTVNNVHSIFTTKSDHYNFLHCLLPRSRFKKISYIKKPSKQQDPDIIKSIASGVELSEREIKSYCRQLNINLENYENTR